MSATAFELGRRGGGCFGISLVDELLSIQDCYAEKKHNFVQWINNLKCLSVIHGHRNIFCENGLQVKDMTVVRVYIAVLYSYEPMEEYESADTGSYTIVNEDGSERKNQVRDIVIFRVQLFAEYVGSSIFWIDGECVNQTKRWEKQVAMDSMDRVEKGSQYPIGSLSTEIRDRSHVLYLASLLSVGIVRSNASNAPPVLVNCDEGTRTGILSLLELLQRDRWWRRAWIFQEEYLGGKRMKLLIRHTYDFETLKRQVFTNERCSFWLIDGEICFPATLYREHSWPCARRPTHRLRYGSGAVL